MEPPDSMWSRALSLLILDVEDLRASHRLFCVISSYPATSERIVSSMNAHVCVSQLVASWVRYDCFMMQNCHSAFAELSCHAQNHKTPSFLYFDTSDYLSDTLNLLTYLLGAITSSFPLSPSCVVNYYIPAVFSYLDMGSCRMT